MPLILETEKFIIKAHDKPHHDRANGGHIVVAPKDEFEHVHQMPADLFIELMQLVALTERVVIRVMKSLDILIVRSNIQINSNWSYKENAERKPSVHVHLYMRTYGEKHPSGDVRFQSFPEALIFPPWESGYYEEFKPLTEEDCRMIRDEITITLK